MWGWELGGLAWGVNRVGNEGEGRGCDLLGARECLAGESVNDSTRETPRPGATLTRRRTCESSTFRTPSTMLWSYSLVSSYHIPPVSSTGGVNCDAQYSATVGAWRGVSIGQISLFSRATAPSLSVILASRQMRRENATRGAPRYRHLEEKARQPLTLTLLNTLM